MQKLGVTHIVRNSKIKDYMIFDDQCRAIKYDKERCKKRRGGYDRRNHCHCHQKWDSYLRSIEY